jgi:hypothetical protein
MGVNIAEEAGLLIICCKCGAAGMLISGPKKLMDKIFLPDMGNIEHLITIFIGWILGATALERDLGLDLVKE